MTTAAQPRPLLAGTLPSTMPDRPLAIRAILEHAVRAHPRKGIVSRDGDAIVRFTYPQFAARVARLAHALGKLGVGPGDRVASFAWNGHRHLELYYAVPMIGAVLHTVNIRLFPDQCTFVLDHAGDSVVFFDGSLSKAVNAFRALEPAGRRRYVAMSPPVEPVDGALDYETLVAREPERYDWPEIDEHAAAILCYTTATTGDPKGVLYSHRSTYLHAMTLAFTDSVGIGERDRLLPVVPMFHANAWGTPFTCPMVGADLVLPMERLDAPSVVELIASERITCSSGVPTVWMAVRDLLRAQPRELPYLKRLTVGGSAVPPSLRDDFLALGIELIQGWGMTEMSPVGTINMPVSLLEDEPAKQREERYNAGLFIPTVEFKIVDGEGKELPHDGVARGELLVRGYTVTASYYDNAATNAVAFEPDGWFHTGDVCTVDEYGYLEIVDRVKDFIKSGGEWISSVEVEIVLMGHPAVTEACVFGVPHPKWSERPVAAVVLRDGSPADEPAIRAWLEGRLARWQIPDRVLFVDAIPRTGVGKFLKRELRRTYDALFSS